MHEIRVDLTFHVDLHSTLSFWCVFLFHSSVEHGIVKCYDKCWNCSGIVKVSAFFTLLASFKICAFTHDQNSNNLYICKVFYHNIGVMIWFLTQETTWTLKVSYQVKSFQVLKRETLKQLKLQILFNSITDWILVLFSRWFLNSCVLGQIWMTVVC